MYEKDRNWILNNTDNGVITSSFITNQGIHRSTLGKMVQCGDLVKISRGIYMLSSEWEDEFYTLQKKYSRGVFSHTTALYLHGYSERVPLRFHMTFPTKYNASSLKKENVVITRVKGDNYELGQISILTPSGNHVIAYDLEHSLCDVLRGPGDDIQIIQYAMKKYASSREKDIYKLMQYARQLHVESKIRKYMEVLL